jgi:uncharacterized protein (DUF58 family)
VTARAAAAIALILAGATFGVPVATVLGIVALMVEVVHAVWARRGLSGVRYARRLGSRRLAWGDETALEVEVWNRKALPLAWLEADDAIDDGLLVRDRPAVETHAFGAAMRNTWTLAPYERVVRHLHVRARRRGVFTIGPVDVSVGDLFAREAARKELPGEETITAWPRTVPAASVVRPERWGDLERAHQGLLEDPSRFAGIRPYSPGDPIRRIHARSSARLGRPMTKHFEPSRERDVLIALDLHVPRLRRHEMAGPDHDDAESLFVIAGSLARSLAAEHAAFGLTAAGYVGQPLQFADVPVARSAGQAARVLDLLARLSTPPSAPYERLLARIEHRIQSGTTIVVLTARPPGQFARFLRRLGRAGFGIAIVTAGPDAQAHAAEARRSGFVARAALLDAPWPTASELRLA